MRFNYFHLMPYDVFPDQVEQWPVDNGAFDAEVARRLYSDYLDTMVFAEECGWDSIGCNEHHFSPYGLMSNCNLIGSALIQFDVVQRSVPIIVATRLEISPSTANAL